MHVAAVLSPPEAARFTVQGQNSTSMHGAVGKGPP